MLDPGPAGDMAPKIALWGGPISSLVSLDMTPTYITALLAIAKIWKQPKCPLMDEWIFKCGIYTQRNIIQPKKEGNPAICNNLDEPGGHYAK